MTGTVRVALHASDGEQAAWADALGLIQTRLDLRLTLEPYPSADAVAASGAAILAFSLHESLLDASPFDEVAAAWQGRAERLAAGPLARGDVAFVSTILRHLPPDQAGMIARLRRLNLLAAHLSQAHGVLVVDLDRALAHRGALALRTDARLGGEAGRRAAAQVIAGSVLADGLLRFVSDEALEAALDALAGMEPMIDRLTVPVELIPRKVTAVGRRRQISYADRPTFDERGSRALCRDLLRRRIGPARFVGALWRKLASRATRERTR